MDDRTVGASDITDSRWSTPPTAHIRQARLRLIHRTADVLSTAGVPL